MPETTKKYKIESLIANLLFKNSLSTNIIAIAGSAVVTLFLDTLLKPSLQPWLIFMLIISCIRLFIYRYHSIHPTRLHPSQWIRLYTYASLFAGISWASIVFYLPGIENSATTSVVYLIIIVALTGSLPALSASLCTFYAFTLPISVAAISFYFMEGSRLSFYISLSAALYVFFIISAGRHLNRHIIDSFVLQIKNQFLIKDLNKEISRRKQAQTQLETNQLALEDKVTLRTKELRKINDQLLCEIRERKRIEENLKHLAHHDALTNLPNRLLLDARLHYAIEYANRNAQKIAVLFIDLDNFKNINDSLGHEIGDALLITVSKRLQKSVREIDTVARLGGDEFIVLIEQITKISDLDHVLRKITTTTSQITTIRGHTLYTSASIGISIYPDDGKTIDQLLRNADSAMYQAKASGRNKYHFYTHELTATAIDRVTLETDLRHAIENHQFELFYQPQIALKTKKIVGVEALIRWHHTEAGLLLPDQFLAVAEQCGVMIKLGEWVLKTACEQMVSWKKQHTSLETIAVNLSGNQVRHQGLLQTVQKILHHSRCKAEWLELEITEDFILKDAEHSINTLQQLRKLGISLAIDDFGTGYSSLNHLKHLPVNKLKIDRAFIKDISLDTENTALVQAIIDMGKSLDLTLVAEGVESRSHEIFLKKQGCHIAQGFYYAKPMPANALETFIQAFNNTVASHDTLPGPNTPTPGSHT